jgi:hypothetical protein
MRVRGWLRLVIIGAVLCLTAAAAVVKLYLKDGTYQLAREYQVLEDRVKFFSTDRGEWEEIPLDLVDLKKTQAEIKQREETLREDAKANDEEEKAERAAAREITRVPVEPGAYYVQGDKIVPMKVGEVKIANNKRRNVLKVLSPIPMVSGKATLEMDGLHSATRLDAMQEFYLRLSEEERFGLVRMGEHNGNRVLENLTIVPVTKEILEEPAIVPTYHKQGGEGLYKIWPQKPLEPGEYAIVEYTDGKVNMQSWDFGVGPAAEAPAAKAPAKKAPAKKRK